MIFNTEASACFKIHSFWKNCTTAEKSVWRYTLKNLGLRVSNQPKWRWSLLQGCTTRGTQGWCLRQCTKSPKQESVSSICLVQRDNWVQISLTTWPLSFLYTLLNPEESETTVSKWKKWVKKGEATAHILKSVASTNMPD